MDKISPERAVAIARQARDELALLTRLDPTNQTTRLLYSHSYLLECFYLAWKGGQIEGARKAFREWDAACEPFRERDQRTRGERVWRSQILAALAAAAGDVADARAQIAEAAKRFDFNRERLPADAGGRRRARLAFLVSSPWPLIQLHDWSELERTSRDYLAEVEIALQNEPHDPDLLLHRPMALGFFGHALFREGRIDEAVSVLEEALKQYGETPVTPTMPFADANRDVAREVLGEALTRRSETLRGREVLEEVLKARELSLTATHNAWPAREVLAGTLMRLAATYSTTDPDETVRRGELLARAEILLNGPDAEGRITMDGKAAKAQIEQMLHIRRY